MEAVIMNADTLNLPEAFAAKLRGRKVEITEKDNISQSRLFIVQ